MFLRKHYIGVITVFILSLFLLQLQLATAVARTRTNPLSANEAAVAAAKEALADAGTLHPVEGEDTNMNAMAQDIINQAAAGVTVKVYKSYNQGVSRTGAITYNTNSSKGNVTFKLTKDTATATISVPVVVPAKFAGDPDAEDVAAAKSALADAGTFHPVEGEDSNVIAMAQDIVDKSVSGVSIDMAVSNHSQISEDGTIAFGDTEVSGKVTFTLTKNDAEDTQSISVVVPAKKTVNPDAEDVAAAKSALAGAGTFHPTEGEDGNVVVMAQSIVDKAVSGVSVDIAASNNSQISEDGTITFGDTAVTGRVTFTLTKNDAADTQSVSVAVPARALSDVINVMDYGAQGNGVEDDTAAIQNAIAYAYGQGGGTVYIPDGKYLINVDTPLKLKSNVNLNLADNATLKAKPTTSDTYAVVKIGNVSNVEITGGNIVGERDEHLGTGGEWGHGISITGSNNIHVADVSVSDCWGDGIYIGSNTVQNYCSNIVIERFKIDRARRNGISLISGKDVTISDGVISNTNGTKPQCGIDIEPNNTSEFLQDILLDNVQTEYSQGYGLKFSFAKYVYTTNEVTITLRDFSDINSVQGEYNNWQGYSPQNPNFYININ